MTLMEIRNIGRRDGGRENAQSWLQVILKPITTSKRCMQEAVEHQRHARLKKTNKQKRKTVSEYSLDFLAFTETCLYAT